MVSPYLPWPLHTGGHAAQFTTLQSLAQDHELTLLCPAYSETGVAQGKDLQGRLPQVRVRTAFCGARQYPAGGRWLRSAGRSVRQKLRRLWPAATGSLAPPAPYYPFAPQPGPLLLALNEELQRGADLCQVEFAEMMPLGTWLPPAQRKVFIHHQIHFVYARRFIEAHGSNPYSEYLAKWMEIQEAAYLRCYDAIIVFSENDRHNLRQRVGSLPVYCSPFPVPADVEIVRQIPAPLAGRFLFIGSEQHDPNRDGLAWLVREIWPRVLDALPTARLTIAGAWSAQRQTEYAHKRVTFTGFVEDLGSVIRGSIVLVPVRIGSGLRTKILAAWASGAPVVSTTIGAEGLGGRHGEHLLLADDAEHFAQTVLMLHKDAELRQRLSAGALDFVLERYTSEAVKRRRNEVYQLISHASGTPQPQPMPSVCP